MGRTALLGTRTVGRDGSFTGGPGRLRIPATRTQHPVMEMYAADLGGRPLGLPGRSDLSDSVRVFRRWPNPEVAAGSSDDDDLMPGHDLTLPPTAEEVPLDTLVQNYIGGRRQAYLDQGWERFEQRQYREATDRFNLADSISIDNPHARAEIKGGLVYAALAARQYSVAVSSLEWLLRDERRTGRLPDPDIFGRLPVAEDVYGRLQDYDTHLREVVQFGMRHQDSPEAIALRAVMMWFNRDTRSRALFLAERLRTPDTPQPWSRLPELLERAASAEQPVVPPPPGDMDIGETGRPGLVVPPPPALPGR